MQKISVTDSEGIAAVIRSRNAERCSHDVAVQGLVAVGRAHPVQLKLYASEFELSARVKAVVLSATPACKMPLCSVFVAEPKPSANLVAEPASNGCLYRKPLKVLLLWAKWPAVGLIPHLIPGETNINLIHYIRHKLINVYFW